MQVLSFLIWLALMFLLAKIVNHIAKRPVLNPWILLAAGYAFSYIAGMLVGLARGTPNLAYIAGSFLPITLVAVALGIWRAPKWKAAKQLTQEQGAIGAGQHEG